MSAEYSYVVSGAILKCSGGSFPNYLNIKNSYGVYVKEKPICTVKDCKAGENITTFGKCKLKKGGCQPKFLTDWIGGKADVKIKGDKKPLIDSCHLVCAHGGEVTITDDGQEGNTI